MRLFQEVGFLLGGTGACPLVCGNGSHPSDRQAMSRVCFEAAAHSRWLYAACVLISGAVFPPCSWWFSQRCSSTRAYSLLGGQCVKTRCDNEDTQETSCRYFHHQCPCFHSKPKLAPIFSGDFPIPAGMSGPDSHGTTALPHGPMHVKPCVCQPRVESLFSQLLWISCDETH